MTNYTLVSMAVCLLIAGCATTPTSPSNMALPGTGKNFDQFRSSDFSCRDYALTQIGGKTVNQQYNQSLGATTAVGTAIGALIGAAAGGGHGAALGAGMGAVTGGAIGVNTATISGDAAQDKYDNAYYQCMYAAGHRIPVPASMAGTYPQTSATSPGTGSSYYPPPPPPPGYSR